MRFQNKPQNTPFVWNGSNGTKRNKTAVLAVTILLSIGILHLFVFGSSSSSMVVNTALLMHVQTQPKDDPKHAVVVPNSGGGQQHGQLEALVRAQVQERFSKNATRAIPPYYFLHIPKAAGEAMIQQQQVYKVPVKGFAPTTSFSRVTNKWNTTTTRREGPLILSSEGFMFDPAMSLQANMNTMVLLRNPRHHIISQYSHCVESKHARFQVKEHLQTLGLEGWLDHHLAGLEAEMSRDDYANETWAMTYWAQSRNKPPSWGDPTFHCYIPINHQAWKLHRPTSAMQLASTYKFVGIVDEFDSAACLMAILATYPTMDIPPSCLCDNNNNDDDQAFVSHDTKPQTLRLDHGVKSHGDTTQVSLQVQQKLDALSQLDQQLYEWAKEIFWLQKRAVEDALNIQLC